MNIQSIEAKLKKVERERERLSKQLEARKEAQFTSLPAKVGLRNVDQLILSLAPYASSNLRAQLPGNRTPTTTNENQNAVAKNGGTRGRRRYTQQHKAAVKAALETGGKTVPQIAKETGVSEFSVIDWKKQWGLVKKRKKSAKKK